MEVVEIRPRGGRRDLLCIAGVLVLAGITALTARAAAKR
jgi:hypothetical protein